MREIKFRAWDGEKIILDGETLIRSNEWWYGKPNENGLPLGAFSGIDGHVLMQYTGLKDRNGKEIYEGDIIASREGARGVVRWRKWSFEQDMINTSGWWVIQEQGEVIGNIYEHPELL